jgi:DNA-binding CsgD family transcriptional regulator
MECSAIGHLFALPVRHHPTNDGNPMSETHDESIPRPQIVLAAFFLVITVGAAMDLLMDRPGALLSMHVLFELVLLVVSLGAGAYLGWGWYSAMTVVRALRAAEDARARERDAWRSRSGSALEGLRDALVAQFDAWDLTPAERETALMILKGYSHKRIGRLAGRSERTVRQHAVAVYRKAGVATRSELSAFFLEGLVLPPQAPPDPRSARTSG